MDVEPLAVGEQAPEFELPGTDERGHSLSEKDEEAAVVVFTCNHCPVAQAYQDRLVALEADYDDAAVVAINSNDAGEYPEDSFEKMVERAEEAGFNFPYLRDESQEVAAAYGAQCTPHAFVLNGDRQVVYEGAIDDDKQGEDVTERYVREAIDAVLAGESQPRETVTPMGCSIKWKASA